MARLVPLSAAGEDVGALLHVFLSAPTQPRKLFRRCPEGTGAGGLRVMEVVWFDAAGRSFATDFDLDPSDSVWETWGEGRLTLLGEEYAAEWLLGLERAVALEALSKVGPRR